MMLTYNHAPYIGNAIEMVLAQETVFPYELIIGEDCSTDGTREIVLDYAARYPDVIRVVMSDNNIGSRKNSLRALRIVRGHYIAWCEGDDYWHRRDKLQRQVAYLQRHRDCGLVYSDYDKYFVETSTRIEAYLRTTKKDLADRPHIEDIVAGRAGILTCTVVARKDLVCKVIESDRFLHISDAFLMGDTQLWAEISTHARVHRIDESLATRNVLPESATRSADRGKVLRFWISNAEMSIYLCDKYELEHRLRDLHVRDLRRKALQLAFHERNIPLAKRIRERYRPLRLKDLFWYCATILGLPERLVKKMFSMKNLFSRSNRGVTTI
jgi:glycosyltransferase involved in cell wall biosynthesis